MEGGREKHARHVLACAFPSLPNHKKASSTVRTDSLVGGDTREGTWRRRRGGPGALVWICRTAAISKTVGTLFQKVLSNKLVFCVWWLGGGGFAQDLMRKLSALKLYQGGSMRWQKILTLPPENGRRSGRRTFDLVHDPPCPPIFASKAWYRTGTGKKERKKPGACILNIR